MWQCLAGFTEEEANSLGWKVKLITKLEVSGTNPLLLSQHEPKCTLADYRSVVDQVVKNFLWNNLGLENESTSVKGFLERNNFKILRHTFTMRVGEMSWPPGSVKSIRLHGCTLTWSQYYLAIHSDSTLGQYLILILRWQTWCKQPSCNFLLKSETTGMDSFMRCSFSSRSIQDTRSPLSVWQYL